MNKLSIIVPVYNEEKTIALVLKKIIEQPTAPWKKEIVVIDDGSTDGTELKIGQFENQVKYLKSETNQGKGAALRAGIKIATGDAIIIQDADLEYDPADWPKLLDKFDNQSAVYGSRNIKPEKNGYSHYVLGVKLLTLLTNLLYKSKLTDIYTCYKLLPASTIKTIPLKSNGFEIEAEITARLLKGGLIIQEVPISYNPRKFSEGKKIRLKDGASGLWTIFKIWKE